VLEDVLKYSKVRHLGLEGGLLECTRMKEIWKEDYFHYKKKLESALTWDPQAKRKIECSV